MTTPDRLRTALADHYRLDREIGAGGMATVHLAHDLKHDRDVAIKVLHPDLGAALGGERFLSEIRTTARLQHPHILPLLDSGAADGLLYYVMPLVTGETLRARLDRERQLPVAEAVRIAREVASALDYAHRQGVIHRDIKPENILLHEGSALVADFGIALAVQSAGGARMTQTGLSLGTPQYMSPEQAMGERTIDARSDIYALGAVTYEMLTGEPPFTGATVQAIVSKVLTEKPTHPTAVRDTIPRHVEATVLMALAKVPADRFATAAEFGHALVHAEATAGLAIPGAAAGAAHAHAGAPAGGVRGAGSSKVAWAVAAAAVLVAAWGWLARPAPDGPVEGPMLSEAMDVGLHQSALLAGVRSTSLSQDGSHLAWLGVDSATGGIQAFVAALADGHSRAVPGTAGASVIALSPDGKSVMFARLGEMLVTGVDGGVPRRLMPSSGFGGHSWTTDGWIVFGRQSSLWRMRVNGSDPELLVQGSPDTAYSGPTAIEEAGTLVFARTIDGRAELMARALDGGEMTPLGIEAPRGHYARGRLVFVGADGVIRMVGFDARKRRTVGEPVPIGGAERTMSAQRFELARTGLLALVSQPDAPAELVLADRSGRARSVGERRWYMFPRFDATGSRAIVGIKTSTVNTREGDLWSLDLATGVMLRLTNDGLSTRPVVEPDGRSLLFSQRDRNGIQRLARVAADGTGVPTTLVTRTGSVYEALVTADGRTLVWREDAVGTGRDIMAAPLDSPQVARPVLQTRFSERGIAAGAVEDWIAYVSDESGRDEVYIRHATAEGGRWPVSRNGGVEPRWSRSGEMFFRKGDSVFVSRVTPGAEPRIGEPALLFTGVYQLLRYEPTWDVSADGQRFLFVREMEKGRARVMLYSNWMGGRGER